MFYLWLKRIRMNRKYFLFIPLFLIPLFLQAQGINFFEGSFQEVKAEAKKQNKIIFIDCYTSWCGPCKWMAKNVFTDKKVGDFTMPILFVIKWIWKKAMVKMPGKYTE